jgi:hypothetical protein
VARDVAALARLGRQVAEQQGYPADDPTIDYAKYGQEAEYRIGRNQGVPPPDKFRIGHQQPRVAGHVRPRQAPRGAAVAGPPDLEPVAERGHSGRSVRIGAFEVRFHEQPRAANRPQHKDRKSERTTGRLRVKRRGPFADPGYQPDRKPRYQIGSAAKVRAAWAYINRPAYARKYTATQLRLIHQRIQAAGRSFGVEFGHARARTAGHAAAPHRHVHSRRR